MLLVEDTGTGLKGINTVTVYANCGDIQKPGCCGEDNDLLTLLKKMVVVDSCGRFALQLIANTTDAIES